MKNSSYKAALRKKFSPVNNTVSSSKVESKTLPIGCSTKTASRPEKAELAKPTRPCKTEHGGFLDSESYSVRHMQQVQTVCSSEDYMSLCNREHSRYYQSSDSILMYRLKFCSTDQAVKQLGNAFCTYYKKRKARLITKDKLIDTIEVLNDVKFTEFWPQATELNNLIEQKWTDDSSRQLDAINLNLKKLNRKLFVKLMAVVYDTKKEAQCSSNIRINNVLFDELQKALELKSMFNEHFVNSILLYFLYCLNPAKADQVYAIIKAQTLSR